MGHTGDPLAAIDDAQIEARIAQCLGERDERSSCCPSDIARALAADGGAWRALMPRVREVAARLAREGRLSITRGSEVLADGDFSGGPVRLRRGARFNSTSE